MLARTASFTAITQVRRKQQGVTLVELVVGITVLAIALTLITSILSPLFVRSTDPWHQVRAAELGQSLLNEILALSFDENSNRSGGLLRCAEAGAPACTPVGQFGPDGSETRLSYNDVDDFHGFVGSAGELSSLLGEELASVYLNYQVMVTVSYPAPEQVGGISLPAFSAKRITVAVTTPTGSTLQFSAYRGNW